MTPAWRRPLVAFPTLSLIRSYCDSRRCSGTASIHLCPRKIRFQVISREDAGPPILALGVFRSFAGPHQVVYAGSRRFWVRGQNGTYQPDVVELRHLFLTADSWLRQADETRTSRLSRLRMMPDINTSSITLIHVLPLAPSERLLDLPAHQAVLNQRCPPLQRAGWSARFNADGYMTFTQGGEDRKIFTYTQWFRTGGTEGFSSDFVGEPIFTWCRLRRSCG